MLSDGKKHYDGRKTSIKWGRRCGRCEERVHWAAGDLRSWCEKCGDYVSTKSVAELKALGRKSSALR